MIQLLIYHKGLGGLGFLDTSYGNTLYSDHLSSTYNNDFRIKSLYLVVNIRVEYLFNSF